ncbi:MAG: 50S ribosomal protein L25 [Thermodesulfovibrionia bacterium]
MEKILLKAEKRTELGKGSARSLRRSDILPAVLYAKGFSIPIKLHRKDILSKLMVSGKSEHALVTIELSGDKGKKTDHWVLVKDYQLDPVRNELLHVDFIEISLKKKIKTTVPVVVTEEPAGVKKGGILQQQLRDVEIECLPTQIPDSMEVDASAVDIGHSLHVSDLKIKEGVKILSDPQDVILTVIAPVVEEVAPEAPAEEEVSEPELVKKTKEEEGAEENGAKGKEQKKQKEQKKK